MKKVLKMLLGMLLITVSVSVVGGLIHNEKVTPIFDKNGVYIEDKIERDTFTEGFVKTFVGVTIMSTIGCVFFYGVYLLIEDKKW